MSFRRFIYYCTLVGAWTALLAWGSGRILSNWTSLYPTLETTLYAILLALAVAFGVSLVDALGTFSPGQVVSIFLRVATAMSIALLGSSACGSLVGWLYSWSQWSFVFIFVWITLGFLVGVSVAVFDVIAGLVRKDIGGPLKKLAKCTAGGTLGGILGGIMAWLFRFQLGGLLGDPTGNNLWSPTAVGFATLGGLIGLLVGLSQVVLLEAWVRVEAGFRPGRDLIISRDRTVIGRAEGSDIALFGDNGVEKQHAAIVKDSGGYFLEPLPNTQGTYINEVPITARSPLKTGDQIRLGKSLLRFNQRRK
jgi:FHA domain